MDVVSIAAAVAIAKGIPGSAAERAETAQAAAEAAQTAAETAAEQAATHNYGITVAGHTLTITEPTE